MSLKNSTQKVIQEQNEKIARLEKAFRDVTVAYKTLLTEKETLQASIKLMQTNENQNQNDDKLNALKQNIQVLIDAKTKLESNFQLERKTLKGECDDLKQKYEKMRLENTQLRDDYESTMNELRLSLRGVQMEKEKLTQENNFIMKELKKVKIDEKFIEETNIKIDSSNLDNLQAEYKDLIEMLRKENNDLKLKVKELNEKLNEPSDDAVKLEKEINKLKEFYGNRISEDSNQLFKAETNLKEYIEKNEKRTASLESEISQLYKTISNYESQKIQNETRKSSSSEQSISIQNPILNSNLDDQNEDIEKALQKIYELKRFIENKDKHFKFDEVLTPIRRINHNDDKLHEKCREEYKILKDEFDKYKTKTNQLMKARYNKDFLTSNDVNQQQQQQLKEEINYFKNRLNVIEKSKLNDLMKYEDKIKNLDTFINNLKSEHSNEIEKIEKKFSQKVTDLEKQLSKQRERTLKLINDKEVELERLRETPYYKKNNSEETNVGISNDENDLSDSTNSDLQYQQQNQSKKTNDETNILKLTNTNLNETTLLHYSQELAFKDAEISKLRKIKLDLEYRIKQIISDNDNDFENYKKQINILKLEIERLKLNSTRLEASANMEYIKNVVYRFLTTKDINVKINMINAIAQILQFTKQEKSKAIFVNS